MIPSAGPPSLNGASRNEALRGGEAISAPSHAEHAEEEGDEGDERGESEGEEGLVGEIHEVAANLLYLLILLHIAGVVFETRRSGRKVVLAMVPGHR